MPVFHYKATNRHGTSESGDVIGANVIEVSQRLAERGLEVTEIGLAQAGPDPIESPRVFEPRPKLQTEVIGPLVGTVDMRHLNFFFRQLSAMLSAGINPAQALETLSGQTQSPKLRTILLETKQVATAGQPMSAGFQRYPEVFSPMVMSLLRAAEEGGYVESQCKQISEYLQRDIDLRLLIKRETIYPKVTLVVSIVVILAARAIISSLGKSTHLTSPLSEAGTWIILGPIIIGLFLYFRVVRRQPRMQLWWDAFVLKVPYIGKTSHGFAMAKFGRTFAALFKGGVGMAKSMRLAADACGNEFVRSRLYPAAETVREGDEVAGALEQTGIVSPIVIDMARTGDMTGNLDEMLEKMCEFYEEEGAVRAKQAAVFLGVLVLLGTGIYVGFIAYTFYGGLGAQLQQAG